MSILPVPARTANRRSRSAASVTSPCTASQPAPINTIARSSSAWRRPVMTTWAPSVANRRGIARPIPPVPPVTIAVFPVRLDMFRVLGAICARPARFNAIGRRLGGITHKARRRRCGGWSGTGWRRGA